jgi:hypothetical protein
MPGQGVPLFGSEQSIYGGRFATLQDDVPFWQFTARLQIITPEGAIGERCTGVLVSSRIVMTAAHCFKQPSQKVRIYFGLNAQDPAALKLESRHFISHPNYDRPRTQTIQAGGLGRDEQISPGLEIDWAAHDREKQNYLSPGTQLKSYSSSVYKNALYDIALVFLDEPLPAPYKPISFLESGSIPAFGESIYVAGFGLHAQNFEAADDVLRETELNMVGYMGDKKEGMSNLIVFPFQDGAVCLGDSGGPAVVRRGKDFYLVGILLGYGRDCYSDLVYTVPNFYFDWIVKASNQALTSRRNI